ncbi:MAG: DUF624 domain-containing protein [Lachnospiraceae bacterium]|nr:DUF624 domain-containing protein [Lachnospiraceae bacterium]
MFKLDSPLMNFLNRLADIMMLNFLLIIFSIPVFTAGAAISAAYYMGYKMVRNEETYIVKGFWKAFKENFKQATLLWLFLLVVFGILSADYRIILYSGIAFARWIRIALLAVTFVILLGVSFILPLQARFVNPVKNTVKNAFLMAVSHFPTAVLLVALYALPVVLLYIVPQSLPLQICLMFGLIIYIKSYLLLRVFRRYEEALSEQQDGETAGELEAAGSDSGIFAESDRMEREGKMVKVFRNGRFVEVPEKSLKNETK